MTGRGHETVLAVDLFRERVLLRTADGANRTLALADLKREVAAAGGETEATAAPPPPSGLVAFDEGEAAVTAEQAVDAVSPRKRRRRRGRRGRSRRRDRGADSRDADGSGHGD